MDYSYRASVEGCSCSGQHGAARLSHARTAYCRTKGYARAPSNDGGASQEKMTSDLNTNRSAGQTLNGKGKVKHSEKNENRYHNQIHCSRPHGGSFRRTTGITHNL